MQEYYTLTFYISPILSLILYKNNPSFFIPHILSLLKYPVFLEYYCEFCIPPSLILTISPTPDHFWDYTHTLFLKHYLPALLFLTNQPLPTIFDKLFLTRGKMCVQIFEIAQKYCFGRTMANINFDVIELVIKWHCRTIVG